MPKPLTEPSLKSLREQLERAQIEAEIKRLTAPTAFWEELGGTAPTIGASNLVQEVPGMKVPHVFTLKSMNPGKTRLAEIQAQLDEAYGERVALIVLDPDEDLYHVTR